MRPSIVLFAAQRENHKGMFEGGAVQTAIEVMRSRPRPEVVRLCGAMLFVMASDKEARMRISAQPGALKALIEMANSEAQDVRVLCGAVLCRLSADIERSEATVQAGAIPALIKLSHWKHHRTRQRCIVAISNLARGRLRARIIDEGAVPALIGLASSKDKKMRQDVASALCNLSCSGVSERQMVEQAAVSALIVLGLVRSADEPVTRKTCGQAIFNLLSAEGVTRRLVEEDVVWALNELCEMDVETQEMFAVAACNLTSHSESRAELVRPGPFNSLLGLIADEDCPKDVRIAAGFAMQNIACLSTPAQLASIAAARPRFASVLAELAINLNDAMVKESCASALCALSLNMDCRRAFLEGGGLQALTELAKVGHSTMNQYCSASLFALASSEETRRLAIGCGAMTLIRQLSASMHIGTKEHCARTIYLFSLAEDVRFSIISQAGVQCITALAVLNTNPLIQSISARSLCLLSCCPEGEAVARMVEDGAVRVVSVLAESIHDSRVRRDCVLALCNLSFNTNSSRMTNDGATHTLCELCDLRNTMNMERIAVVFRNLASHQGNVRRMVSAGVVSMLVAIASKNPGLHTLEHVLVALCLISFEESVREAMAEDGAVRTVMSVASQLGSRESMHYCGLTISNLAADSGAHKMLVAAGAIGTLMKWMESQAEERMQFRARERRQRRRRRQQKKNAEDDDDYDSDDSMEDASLDNSAPR